MSAAERKGFLDKNVEISRRNFIVGAAAGAGAILLAGFVERGVVESEVRDQFLDPGDLTPEIERALLDGNYIIHHTDPAITAQTLSNAGLEFSTMPELEGTPVLTTASKHKWVAFKGTNLYLPREEDATLQDLRSSLTSTIPGSLKKNVESDIGSDRYKEVNVVPPEAIHLLSIENELRDRGETMFTQAGYILTSTTFEVIEGVDEEGEEIVIEKGIGIGRETPDGQLSLITIDLTAEGPAPANLFAGGFIVAK